MMMYHSFRDNVVCIIHEKKIGTKMKTSLLSKDQTMLLRSGQKSDLSEDGFVGINVVPL